MKVALSPRWIAGASARRKLRDVRGGYKAAMLGAIQRTRKEMVTQASKWIRDEIVIKKKDLDSALTTTRPTRATPVSRVTLKKKSRLSLKYFSLKQKTRRDRKTGSYSGSGVSYRISKTKGRKTLSPAFGAEQQVWPKLHGHGFVRTGKSRYPIAKLHGPSAWGVFMKLKKKREWMRYGRERLTKNLQDQVRYRLLKAQGKL